MSPLVALACLVVALRRKGKAPVAVPVVLGSLAALAFGRLLVAYLASALEIRKHIGGTTPADKATVLAASFAEALNTLAFDCAVWLPLAVGGFVLDRWMRRRGLPLGEGES